ncbi:preprotein translocase subunit SecA [Staphylococcus aureus]
MDDQLRGRSARQAKGIVALILSLQDELMIRFGSR